MIKTTVEKLRESLAYANACKNHKSPFGYACLRSVYLIEAAIKKETEEFESKQHELAILNEDKSYKMNDKDGLIFTKENQDKLNDFWKEQNKIIVDYEPYIATNIDSVKNDLPLLDKLNGIIVNVDIEKLYMGEETTELKKVEQN